MVRVLALGLVCLNAHSQDIKSDLRALYDTHRWFDLRHEVISHPAPAFYKAAVAAVFNQFDGNAVKELQAVIQSDPPADLEVEAREELVGLYYRTGKYQEALSQAVTLLKVHPGQADMLNILPTLQALAPYGSQHVVKRSPSSLKMEVDGGNLVLPVSVNGIGANYIFDNGFSLSGISESEARRLHLVIHEVMTHIDTMSGAPVKVRVAMAPTLSVGGVELTNVAFYVLPDSAPPFNDLAAGRQGILGLPVILAVEHFEWNTTQLAFTILPGDEKSDLKPNLALEGTSTLVQVLFRGKPLEFSLDLGAQKTLLYPKFLQDFPDLQDSSKEEAHRVTGVGGSAEIDSITIPSLTLNVGDDNRSLAPAHVLLHNNNSTSGWFSGNLAMDLLSGPNDVEIDFRRSRLTIH